MDSAQSRQEMVCNAVLQLLSPLRKGDAAGLEVLSEDAWDSILSLADRHRFKPLLHWRLARDWPDLAVPEPVRESLAAGFVRATFLALESQKELVGVHEILARHGIEFVTLKGPYLAFYCYPHPALRPLRDLDLLVRPADALRAYECLLASGATRLKEFPGRADAALAFGHHLPPLYSPTGRNILEVHPRVLHPHVLVDATVDLSWDERYWRDAVERRIGNSSIRFSSPIDLLLQLIVHSVYEHSFNNGPLVLSDVGFLLERAEIDWNEFWRLAETYGLARGAVLLLRLFEKYWGARSQIWEGQAIDRDLLSADVIDAAAYLLFRDPKSENHATLTSTMARSAGPMARARLAASIMFPPREAIAAQFPVAVNSPFIPFFYLKKWWWLLTERFPAYLRERRRATFGLEVQGLLMVHDWLSDARAATRQS